MGVNFSDDAGVGSTKIAAGTLASGYASKLLSSILTLLITRLSSANYALSKCALTHVPVQPLIFVSRLRS
jgi:hypothetical protein